jgi:phosphatidylinositol alpha-mannosyltransferase
MRIGIVCPYDWDTPGGVQVHVRDLAQALIDMGHHVSVLAPADLDDENAAALPPYLVPAGRTVPVPYNGSVARFNFGVISATRVRRWLREGDFDVVHVHEPTFPNISLLACYAASVPIVATFHTAMERSRLMAAAASALQTGLEKIAGRIAVSESARTTLVEHLGGDAVLIPNGVTPGPYRGVEPLPGWPGEGGALGFLGRIDEPRKGLDVLVDAFERLGPSRPGLRLLIAGPGDTEDVRQALDPALRDRVTLLGLVDEQTKARMLHSVDVYVAPNTGGESFGIVLLEAMAARTPVLASDIEAFARVLEGGHAGRLFPVGDADGLARAAAELLDSPEERERLRVAGDAVVARYDWSAVAKQVLTVYETVL